MSLARKLSHHTELSCFVHAIQINSLGSAEAGRLVDSLQLKQHWAPLESYRAAFFQYSFIGGAMIGILVVAGLKQWLSLPHIEVLISNEALLQSLDPGAESPSEQSSSSGSYHQTLPSEAREECNQKWDMSFKSMCVMMHLSLLVALDSFTGGVLTGEHCLFKRQHWVNLASHCIHLYKMCC